MKEQQLTFDFNRRSFSRCDFERAHQLLEELEDPYAAWPEGVDQPPQHVWDTKTHTYKDKDVLERDALRRLSRSRIPFGIRPIVDKDTGEILGHRQISELLVRGGFFEFTMPGTVRVVKGGSTKRRQIQAPDANLERLQKSFLDWAPDAYELHTAAYGTEEGKSYLDSAIAHAGNRYFLTIDISSAYNNVEPRRLATELADTSASKLGPLGWYPLVRKFFMPEGARRGIATGGNASPMLFNIYMRRFDKTLAAYALAFGLTYTRYMDDITISSPDSGNPDFDRLGKGTMKFAKAAMRAMEFKPNHHKIRVKDVANDGPVMLPGTELGVDGVWRIPSRSVRNIMDEFNRIEGAIDAHNVWGQPLRPEDIGRLHGINSYVQHFLSRRRSHKVEPDSREVAIESEYYRIRSKLPASKNDGDFMGTFQL